MTKTTDKSKMSKNKKLLIVAITEIVLFILAIIILRPHNRILEYSDGMTLPRGSYYLDVNYSTKIDTAYIISYEKVQFSDFSGSASVSMPAVKNNIRQEIRIEDDAQNLFVRVVDENCVVDSIRFVENNRRMLHGLAILLALFLLADFCIFSELKNILANKEQRFVFLIAIGSILLASIPIVVKYIPIFSGHDATYHIARIEGIKAGLSERYFPVRIYPNVLYGFGEMTSAFYPDLFLYIPAGLRFIGFSVAESYKIFLFLINVFTMWSSYRCFKKMFASRWLGVLASSMYLLAAYRLTNMYLRGALGEVIAMSFFPIVVYCIYKLVFLEKTEKCDWLLIACAFSGILESHLLSFMMIFIFSFITLLIGIKRIVKNRGIITLLKAAVAMIGINIGFIVPFLYYYSRYANVDGMRIADISALGTYVVQLLQPFPEIDGQTYWVGWGASGNMPLNIGLPLVLGVLLFIIFSLYKKEPGNKLVKIGWYCLGVGLICLYMTTYYFPWIKFQKLASITDKIVQTIQFPWRLLAPATILFVIVGVIAVKFAYSEGKIYGIVATCLVVTSVVISGQYFVSGIIENANNVWMYDENDIDPLALLTQGQYLPKGVTEETLTTPVENSSDSYIDYQLVAYDGYIAYDEAGKKLAVSANENQLVRVDISGGYTGDITIRFTEPWYLLATYIISWGSCIGLVIFYFFGKSKKNKQNILIV